MNDKIATIEFKTTIRNKSFIIALANYHKITTSELMDIICSEYINSFEEKMNELGIDTSSINEN